MDQQLTVNSLFSLTLSPAAYVASIASLPYGRRRPLRAS